MLTLHVKSLPFKDVINDLARELGTIAQEDCDVYYLKVPDSTGTGSISGINFPTGLGVIYYSCTFNTDVQIRFDVSDIHPAKFLYCKEGYLRHCFLEDDEVHDLDMYQSAIVASKGNSGHQIQFKAGVQTEIGSLEIDRRKFLDQIACDLKSVSYRLRELFKDVSAKSKFYHDGNYSATLNQVMTQVLSHQGVGLVRRMYFQAKSLEILTEQIRLFNDDKKDKNHQYLLRQSEVGTIRKIAEEIMNNLNDDHSISILVEKTGLNENKLQAGFRLLYTKSVKAFIHEVRLNTARDLLVNTDLTIAEVVHLIGLSNGGYFSKKFKEHYGMAPSEYRLMFGYSSRKKSEANQAEANY